VVIIRRTGIVAATITRENIKTLIRLLKFKISLYLLNMVTITAIAIQVAITHRSTLTMELQITTIIRIKV